MEEKIRLAIARPASEPALRLGKKERLFIRKRPHFGLAPRGAQAAFHSKLPVRFVPGQQPGPASEILWRCVQFCRGRRWPTRRLTYPLLLRPPERPYREQFRRRLRCED